MSGQETAAAVVVVAVVVVEVGVLYVAASHVATWADDRIAQRWFGGPPVTRAFPWRAAVVAAVVVVLAAVGVS